MSCSKTYGIPATTSAACLGSRDSWGQCVFHLYLAHCQVWATWEKAHISLMTHCPFSAMKCTTISCCKGDRGPMFDCLLVKIICRVTFLCKVISIFTNLAVKEDFFLNIKIYIYIYYLLISAFPFFSVNFSLH